MMTGLDTNILVRYLVQDDPGQSRVATALIEGAASRREDLFLSSVVLCELVWVLESAYGVARPALTEALEKILMADPFEVEHRDCAWAALTDFRRSKADFSDCLIGRMHSAAGCGATVTFDKAAIALPTFEAPPEF